MTAAAASSPFERTPRWLAAAAALVAAAVLYLPVLDFSVSDFNNFVGPWLAYIRSHGGFAALADDFSEYAPPYLYLLATASYFDLPFSDQVLVKLINVPFVAISSVAIYHICRHFGRSANHAFAMAALTWFVPTLGINAFVWGQADLLYVSMFMLCVLLVLKQRPYWAMAVFGLALGTKLQAMFIAPFVLGMVFAGRIPWQAGFVTPLVYVLTLLPAFFLGRPLHELLQIYLVQGRFYHRLSFNAANPYFFLDFFFGAKESWTMYRGFTLIGLAASSIGGALLSLTALRRTQLTDRAVLIAAALSVTLMPFILPKMHDRYFIGADALLFALACVDRRFIWTAVAMQASSLLSYTPEFSLYVLPGEGSAWEWGVVAGAVINAGVVAHLVLALRNELGGRLWEFSELRQRLSLAGTRKR